MVVNSDSSIVWRRGANDETAAIATSRRIYANPGANNTSVVPLRLFIMRFIAQLFYC